MIPPRAVAELRKVVAELRKVAAALVVADETGASVSASDLPAAGGWGVLDPRAAFARRYGAFDVSVVFDGEAALSARLVRPNLGTLLFIR